MAASVGCATPLVEAVVDDIEFSADAPARPRNPARKINDALVGLIKLEVELAHYRVPEPFDIFCRPALQFRQGANIVAVHELFYPALRGHCGARTPDDVTAKLELRHGLAAGS